MTIEEIIRKLDAIAKKNNDKFRYRMEFFWKGGLLFHHFICEETADNHTFTDGQGLTIGAAVEDADRSIPDQCESWGYKQ